MEPTWIKASEVLDASVWINADGDLTFSRNAERKMELKKGEKVLLGRDENMMWLVALLGASDNTDSFELLKEGRHLKLETTALTRTGNFADGAKFLAIEVEGGHMGKKVFRLLPKE